MMRQNFDLDRSVVWPGSAKVSVDASRDALAVSDAVDDQAWAEDTVAARKHARRRSHQAFGIGHDQSPRADLHTIFRGQKIEPRGLADGKDHGVALDDLL